MTDQDLSPETRALLSRGRDGHALSESRRRGLKRAVLTQVAAGGVLATTTTAAAWTSAAVKLAGVAAVTLAVGGGVHALAGSTGARQATRIATSTQVTRPPASPAGVLIPAQGVAATQEAPSSTPQVASVPPAPSVQRSTPVAIDSRPPALAPAAPPPRLASGALSSVTVTYSPVATPVASAASEPSGESPSLHAEAQLLLDADAALKRGDAPTCLRLLDEHASRFPRSMLEPERSAERVVALCQAGRTLEARRETRVFLTGHQSGPLTVRVQASCGAR